jgi:hypothetical protein
VWGVPTIGLDHPVEALALKNDGGRSRAGVRRHFAPREGLAVVEREGLLVTDRVRTVLDLAAFTPFAKAVAPVDHVLRSDPNQRLRAITKAELEAGIGSVYSAAAVGRIRAVLEFADPCSGSAGESYSRGLMHAAGFEAPVLQQKFVNSEGLVGYSDFFWKESRVVGEFDGEGKYLKPEFLKGRTAAEAVILEKKRENKIRSLGFDVVRWDWKELMTPGKVEGMLAEAGVPRRRTRSALLGSRTQA